ncbi:MAG: hypothetical protein JXB26_09075 [Candidatus Aminicenantes bacterium]|nr:hypothetical protein [Candidatus Aminicenantes bacterium]
MIICFLITSALIQILAASVLFRRHTNLVLFSYLIFLVLWDFYAIFEFVFISYIRFIPKTGRLSFLLFIGISFIMIHGLTFIFFADFMRRWMKKRLSLLLKGILFLPFLIIQIIYTHHAIQRLTEDPAPKFFQVKAPFSTKLMLIFFFAWLFYSLFDATTLKNPHLKKTIRLFSTFTLGGLASFVFFLYSPLSDDLNFVWLFGISSLWTLGINVPGFMVLRNWYGKQKEGNLSKILPENLSRLKDQYGFSAREQEILSLVLTGRTNREIGHQLHISLETVKKHIYNIFKKAGVKNRLQLMNLLHKKE